MTKYFVPGRPVIRLSSYLGTLTGRQRNLAAFLFGTLATLTLPPFFLFPLLIPAFTCLYWLLEGAPTKRRAFWDGWWWGWGFYISGLYWFCIALLTDPEHFAWLLPFALFGLTGVIAIYQGMACWLMTWIPARGLSRIFIFSVVWTSVEYGRGHWFSGFPWNLAGYSFAFSNDTMQMASLIGAYGLTWFSVLLGSCIAAWGNKAISPRHAALFTAVIWGLFAAGTGWGAWRLHEADQLPESARYVPGVKLRLVQANITQPHKWDPQLQAQGLQEYIRLTQSPGLEHITHVIWPETAVPYVVKPGTPLTHLLGDAVPPNAFLIAGVMRAEGEDDNWQIWNSLMAFDHDGDIVGTYDKAKLVPFGEFQPFRSFLPKAWLTPVGDRDFSRGPGPQTLEWPGLPPLSPLICYEAIFPEQAVAEGKRPQLLLNVTNDAWFGRSSGPYQHFHMARMRAAERGIPLVRVANTGITAVVDSYGRVLSSLALGSRGILDVNLPVVQNTITIYTLENNMFLLFLVFFSLLLMLLQRKNQKN